MAGTTPETKTLERIWTIAAAYAPVGASRVFKGFKKFTDAENLNALIRGLTAYSQGYFWCTLRSIPSQGNNEIKRFRFSAQLFVYVPKDTSIDLVSAWDCAVGLRDALEKITTYQDGEFAPKVSIALSHVDVVAKGGIAIFDFGSGEAGGEMYSIDP
jgi:hypothetical protein